MNGSSNKGKIKFTGDRSVIAAKCSSVQLVPYFPSPKMSENRPPTAGIIVIGDEILKGHVHDTNSHYLCQQLWKRGIRVCKTTVVPDSVDAVASEVKLFASSYDYVITSGGIGPTHDDVTMEGIARAFNEELQPHPDMLKALFGKDKLPQHNSPWIKMAMVPPITKVHLAKNSLGDSVCPLMVVHNVHPYAGVPSALKQTFQAFQHLYLSKESTPFLLKEVFFGVEEDQISAVLAETQQEFSHSVQIGSYPEDSSRASFSVKVNLEGTDKVEIDKAYARLLQRLPLSAFLSVVNSYREGDDSIREDVSWFLDEQLGNRKSIVPFDLLQRLSTSFQVFDQLFDKYKLEEIAIAFNGGKDCTLLLALFHAVLKRRRLNSFKIQAFCVTTRKPFPEIEEFMSSCSSLYDLEMISYNGTIKDALRQMKTSHPEIKAHAMGTRRTDHKYAENLEVFSPTDESWPEYMRVHCIMDWSYTQVWLFLRLFNVPYCKLYDMGYTSLGSIDDTHPNPALQVNGSSHNGYRPAYMLLDDKLERVGRSTV